MRVLVVGNYEFTRHPAGSERNIYNLVYWLKHYGVEVVEAYLAHDNPDVVELAKQCDIGIFSEWTINAARKVKGIIPVVIRTHGGNHGKLLNEFAGVLWNSGKLCESSIPLSIPQHVLYSVPIREEIEAEPGEAIAITNTALAKGAGTFAKIIKARPHGKYLAIRTAWDRNKYPEAEFPAECRVIEPVIPPREIWKQVRILVSPSHKGCLDNAMIEALWNGIPVISEKTDSYYEIGAQYGAYGVCPDCAGSVSVWLAALDEIEKNYDEYSRRAKTIRDDPRLQPERVKEAIAFLRRLI